MVTILITLFRVLGTLRVTTPEPPSKGKGGVPEAPTVTGVLGGLGFRVEGSWM